MARRIFHQTTTVEPERAASGIVVVGSIRQQKES
jgi:hypothetical protein